MRTKPVSRRCIVCLLLSNSTIISFLTLLLYLGWSREGQKQYNVLYDKVLQDRNKEGHREAFDQLFYNHYKAMKATVATVTHKEESVTSPNKMRFRGCGSEPEIIGEPEEV